MNPRSSAAIVASGYFVVASTYAVFSSWIVRDLSRSAQEHERVDLVKDIAFVSLTSLGLFLVASYVWRKLLADADEAERAREVFLRSERSALAGLFVSSIAHDANNVAAVVISALQGLAKQQQLDVDSREALDNAQESMARLMKLFENLKQMGRHRSAGERVVTELRALVEHNVGLLRGHGAMKHCQVRIDAPTPVSLAVFPVLIDQVLINLLLNAADATQGRGHIKVRIYEEAGEVRLEVHDDGNGVPPEIEAQLFTPFSTTKPHGTGLGLVSVKECAAAHKGHVRYARSPLGGANFTVCLPILAPV